ncbi:MAG TPA: hypothetical protein VFG11_10735 [Acidobacteriota bacterium]|nr:hypothetical protein [Acidobacteriota bacterium]
MLSKRSNKDFLDDAEITGFIENVLHPHRKTDAPVIAIQFGVPKGKENDWREAISFASAHNTYSTDTIGKLTRHRIEFKPDQVWEIHQMYQMLERSPHLEIFIDQMRLPFAATLWLPLLWFYL